MGAVVVPWLLSCTAKTVCYRNLRIARLTLASGNKVNQSLNLRSQRNLYLCNSYLYSKWQLHVPDHKGWKFVEAAVDVLEGITTECLCGNSSHIEIMFPARGRCVTCIRGQTEEPGAQFGLSSAVSRMPGNDLLRRAT